MSPARPDVSGDLLRAKPDPGAASVRLVVDVAPDAAAQAEVEAVADAVLGVDARGQRWAVAPVFPEAAPDEPLARFHEVRGALNAATLPRAAFDLAYRVEDGLSAGGRPARVRPDLPSTIYARPPTARWPVARAEAHLPESTDRKWALRAIRCPAAWQLPPKNGGAAKGAGTVVGHPDTGYADHAELEAGLLDLARDHDFVNNDDDARDPLDPFELPPGHGTRTASVIAGRQAGEVSGAAPKATIVPIRATRSVALATDVDVARSVDYARRIGCHVVSMSLGGVFVPGALEVAVNAAAANGVIVMAAAGNWDWAGPLWPFEKFVVWPAAYRNCIAVAASNALDKPWSGTSRGPKVLISAPGESIWVPALKAGVSLTRGSGTSYAVAHLAGVAALWLSHWNRAWLLQRYGAGNLAKAFVAMLRRDGFRRPPGWQTDRFGVGIVDANAALKAQPPAPETLETRDVAVERGPETTARQRVEVLFPEEGPEAVEARLEEIFGVGGVELDDRIERFGDELVYLLAEHPEFHGRLAEAGPRAGPGTAGTDLTRALLLSVASPQLANAVADGR